MFSGRQTHRGKSQSPVAWVALVEETKPMKPTDKAILGMVSKSSGRNESEPIGGLENEKPRRPSPASTIPGITNRFCRSTSLASSAACSRASSSDPTKTILSPFVTSDSAQGRYSS